MHISTLNYNTHVVLVSRAITEKVAITGQTSFLYWQKSMFLSGFRTIYSYFSSLHRHNSFTVIKTKIQHVADNAGQHIFICQCHTPNLSQWNTGLSHQNLKNFIAMCTCTKNSLSFMQPTWTPAELYVMSLWVLMHWHTCKSLLNTLGIAVKQLAGFFAKQAKVSSCTTAKQMRAAPLSCLMNI